MFELTTENLGLTKSYVATLSRPHWNPLTLFLIAFVRGVLSVFERV